MEGVQMNSSSNTESEVVLKAGLASLQAGVLAPLRGPDTRDFSERCVEVPWVAGQLGGVNRLLDVGWAMSPPEWLGVLFAVADRGTLLTGIDIINPSRVKTRYPTDLVDRVLSTPVRVEDFLLAQPSDGRYDAITCVSTLEHIGFDVASPESDSSSAFVRSRTPEGAVAIRDPQTDQLFLDAAARLLVSGGSLFISVPAGKGLPILHEDSLGLFTHQFEYDETSWVTLTSDPRFQVRNEAFYTYDPELGWLEVESFSALTHQSSALRPYATGCAMVHLSLL